jgi:ATP phosphoribosyltransferase regulatory subunit
VSRLHPDGTRSILPDEATQRSVILETLRTLYANWGYEQVEVPVLERYDPEHPRANQSFKLSDRDSGVLTLRSDFTPALANLLRSHYPAIAAGAPKAIRWQYAGSVWHAIDPELARTREFTQIGLELIGVSNARADAEIIHLARESVRAVGLQPRIEVGNPGFVRALLDVAAVPMPRRDEVADAIDRKDRRDLALLLDALASDFGEEAARDASPREALLAVVDLYGGLEVIERARAVAPWPSAQREIDRLAGVIAEFEDPSELMLDLAMARRLTYYTGVTFRAYTPDFGQPLLGGGRYDGALLPSAAGFSIGLERLLRAIGTLAPQVEPVRVVALDDHAARRLRAAGVRVRRSLQPDLDASLREARGAGIPFVLVSGRLQPVEGVAADAGELASLQSLLEDEA